MNCTNSPVATDHRRIKYLRTTLHISVLLLLQHLMSDGNEGDGEAAAEEEDEHGGQPVTVVNSEWQVAAWGLNSFLC